jgi:hypothetical protein
MGPVGLRVERTLTVLLIIATGRTRTEEGLKVLELTRDLDKEHTL